MSWAIAAAESVVSNPTRCEIIQTNPVCFSLPFFDHQQTITEAPICDFAPADGLPRKRWLPFAGSPADRISGALRAATTRPWD